MDDIEIKLIQYADDTTAVLKDYQSARNFVKKIQSYEAYTGLKINESKTEAIYLGDKPTFKLPNNIKWSVKPVKVLGFYVSWNLAEAHALSISRKLEQIKSIVYSWQHRKLTLNGRVVIIKSLLLSQITHLISCIPFSDDTIGEIENIFYTFLWGCKTHKVKKTVIIQDFCDGGYQMINLESFIKAQKLKWIKLYLTNHDCMWRNFMENMINVDNVNIFLRSNFLICKQLSYSKFYLDVLQHLYELNSIDSNYKKDTLMNQFVFYNKFTVVNHKMLYNEELFTAGLWYISDLYNASGEIIDFDVWKSRGVPV